MERKPILLVEDSADDELLTVRALRRARLANEIVVARDGVEAVALLFGEAPGLAEPPQIVLLDLKLPRLDGHELLRRIRRDARTRLLPVIVLTSSREDKDLVQAYEEGANAFVVKPVDSEEFVKAVGQLGLFWLLVNEAPPGA